MRLEFGVDSVTLSEYFQHEYRRERSMDKQLWNSILLAGEVRIDMNPVIIHGESAESEEQRRCRLHSLSMKVITRWRYFAKIVQRSEAGWDFSQEAKVLVLCNQRSLIRDGHQLGRARFPYSLVVRFGQGHENFGMFVGRIANHPYITDIFTRKYQWEVGGVYGCLIKLHATTSPDAEFPLVARCVSTVASIGAEITFSQDFSERYLLESRTYSAALWS